MQIVIDIHEKDLECLRRTGQVTYSLISGILKGTVLPRKHGRLIDADALNRKDVNCANIPMNFIDTAPTIIEADKEKSDGR